MINISKNDIVLAKVIHPKNKLSTFYEPNPYIVTKVHKRSAKIKNDRGEYVQAKGHLKVLKGDKSKVNIQGSEKPVVTKQPYPFYIPYHIPFVPDQAEPNANEDQERVNSKDESSINENSDATLPYALFSLSDISDLDEKPKLKKRQSKLPTRLQNYQVEIS